MYFAASVPSSAEGLLAAVHAADPGESQAVLPQESGEAPSHTVVAGIGGEQDLDTGKPAA